MSRLAYYTVRPGPPEGGWVHLPGMTADARRASELLRREGVHVRFLRSVFVPEDETCFYIYEAASADDVREAARRAGLLSPHITEALNDGKETQR